MMLRTTRDIQLRHGTPAPCAGGCVCRECRDYHPHAPSDAVSHKPWSGPRCMDEAGPAWRSCLAFRWRGGSPIRETLHDPGGSPLH